MYNKQKAIHLEIECQEYKWLYTNLLQRESTMISIQTSFSSCRDNYASTYIYR